MFKSLRRRQIVINPKLQYGVVGFFVLMSVINILFFLTAIHFSQKNMIEAIDGLQGAQQRYMLEVFIRQSESLLRASLIFTGFSLVLSVVLGVTMLNHIAGPAYAIKRYVDSLLKGEPIRHPLKLRKYDFFYDTAESLSKISEKYNLVKKS